MWKEEEGLLKFIAKTIFFQKIDGGISRQKYPKEHFMHLKSLGNTEYTYHMSAYVRNFFTYSISAYTCLDYVGMPIKLPKTS